jgi:environmental stress-induced protein Ves
MAAPGPGVMRILPAENHRRMPWKNGGGVTTEIAVFPAGAGLDGFEWRLSMANVAVDGPFSSFPGVDRTLAVLEGEGIVLAVEGSPEVALTRSSAPFAFAADKPSSARLMSGPILDLNMMTRRDRFAHRMMRLASGAATVGGSALTIVVCAAGSAELSSGTDKATLGLHDAAIGTEACTVSASADAVLYAVTLESLG